jgi:hypothetical protein
VPYAIRLDEQTRFPVKVDARLNWRKFSTAVLRSVFDAAEPPQAPLTIIDEVSVEIASE